MAKRGGELEGGGGMQTLWPKHFNFSKSQNCRTEKHSPEICWCDGGTIIAEIFHTFFWVNHKMWILIFNLRG